MPKSEIGMIHYYYGPGNGKTSIGLGHIVRALGHQLKPIVIQFCKLHDPANSEGFYYGEFITLTQILQIPVFQYGTHQFIRSTDDITEEYRMIIQQGLAKIREILQKNLCDILILDELNTAIALRLFSAQDFLEILKQRPTQMEIIITGREEIPEIIDIADYVVMLKDIKHPFQKGINARFGIEY